MNFEESIAIRRGRVTRILRPVIQKGYRKLAPSIRRTNMDLYIKIPKF